MRSNIVSKLTIGVVALVVAGCSDVRPKRPSHFVGQGSISIYRQTLDDHVYFAVYGGGIIHSESCTNAACSPASNLPVIRYTLTNNHASRRLNQ